jgi:hypothetical protein
MRFKGMGRDRKYEIPAFRRQAKYGIETNIERPTPIEEYRIEVQGTKYKVGTRICTRILPLKNLACLQEGYIVLGTSYIFSVLILATCPPRRVMSNAERRLQNVE